MVQHRVLMRRITIYNGAEINEKRSMDDVYALKYYAYYLMLSRIDNLLTPVSLP